MVDLKTLEEILAQKIDGYSHLPGRARIGIPYTERKERTHNLISVAATISDALGQAALVTSGQVREAFESLIEKGIIKNHTQLSSSRYAQYCSVPRTNKHIHRSKKFKYIPLREALSGIAHEMDLPSEYDLVIQSPKRIGNQSAVVVYYRDEAAMRQYLQEYLAARTRVYFDTGLFLGSLKHLS